MKAFHFTLLAFLARVVSAQLASASTYSSPSPAQLAAFELLPTCRDLDLEDRNSTTAYLDSFVTFRREHGQEGIDALRKLAVPALGVHAKSRDSPHLTARLDRGRAFIRGRPTCPSGAVVCAAMRTEADYVQEFIAHHLLAGFSHVFLYHDKREHEDEQMDEVVRPFVDAGLATVRLVEGTIRGRRQSKSYNDCFQRVKAHEYTNVSWIATFDLDELLVVHDGRCVLDYLANQSTPSSLAVNWRSFSHGGHSCSQASRLMLEAYAMRWEGDHHADVMTKNIGLLAQVERFGPNPHDAKLLPGFVLQKGDGTTFASGPRYLNGRGPVGGIELRHFHTKSAEEYAFKLLRGYSGAGNNADRHAGRFWEHTVGATVKDRLLEARWIPALRHVLFGEELQPSPGSGAPIAKRQRQRGSYNAVNSPYRRDGKSLRVLW